MKGQGFAIAFVVAAGVATFIMSLSTLYSLNMTREAYYSEYRFTDIFASLKRAPLSVLESIRGIDGVEYAEGRVVAPVNVDIDTFEDPIGGRVISIPEIGGAGVTGSGGPTLNKIYLREGRLPEKGRPGEVVINESFAKEHRLKPGSLLKATINGRQRVLTIVGVGLSPEYVLLLQPGTIIPDYARYGLFWIGEEAVRGAFDMEGAFNDLVISVASGVRKGEVSEARIIEEVDKIIAPYGGLGAVGRMEQVSHRYLSEEFRQLGQMAKIFPAIFLSVAAFLLNVVLSRLVSTQREEIAILKAFGYSNMAVALHYLAFVSVIVLIGVVIGIGAGVWLGSGMANMYMDYYHFPFLHYTLGPGVIVQAVIVSLLVASVGTIFAVRRAALLPPAEAMRPEAPLVYRVSIMERLGFGRLIFQPTRMVVRHLERSPVKSILTVTGIALSCSIVVLGSCFGDAVDYMLHVHYRMAETEDMKVVFIEPTSKGALYELQSLPGVTLGEPFRVVPVRIRYGHKSYLTTIKGIPRGSRLHKLLDENLEPFNPPARGLGVTDYLAGVLGFKVGDEVTIEVLEGPRPVLTSTVSALVHEFTGVSAYMEIDSLNTLMSEGHALSGANLLVDEDKRGEIYDRLKDTPGVAGVIAHEDILRNIREMAERQILTFTIINTIMAITIAFGVVYNSARIALSERSRELASLRVLGFTRGEISYILLLELAILTILAVPLGFLIGKALAGMMITNMATDIFRVPLVVDRSTYAFAAAVVFIAAAVSGLIVRRRLDTLDLVEALKTKE